jgi:hypothetical protein|tara:strand:+ start:475 stop:663 length:189 start_codon:yes stop_codon:yes gene_type:complete
MRAWINTEKERRIFLKCAEELSELTTRLLQHLNKDKDYTAKILCEIKDVEKQLNLLKEIYDV